MTLTIAGYRITLFRFERLERYTVQIDHEAAAKQAAEIKSDPMFGDIKARAAAIRAMKDTEFGKLYIESIARC